MITDVSGNFFGFLGTALPFKLGQIGCFETSVINGQLTLRNNPEERILYDNMSRNSIVYVVVTDLQNCNELTGLGI
jgi:hypothetical protein